jgi:hypothetical protein
MIKHYDLKDLPMTWRIVLNDGENAIRVPSAAHSQVVSTPPITLAIVPPAHASITADMDEAIGVLASRVMLDPPTRSLQPSVGTYAYPLCPALQCSSIGWVDR